MIYSRWGTSRFFTTKALSLSDLPEDQIFRIVIKSSEDVDFTYKELKYNLDTCLHIATNVVECYEGKAVTEKEKEELRNYMKEFMCDV